MFCCFGFIGVFGTIAIQRRQVVAALCAHYPASDGRDPVDVADALETASNAITAEAVDE